MPVRAILLDFNGTVSDDEPLLYELLSDLFAERGKPLSEQEYYQRLVGLTDRDVVRTWLGDDDPDLVAEYVRRYVDRAGDGSTIAPAVREAIRGAAGVARLAIVSGAPREAIESALAGAGLGGEIGTIVSADDVVEGKPDPEGYLLALLQLEVAADHAAAVEDSPRGIQAAKAAGLYTVAVRGTADPALLVGADEVADRLDAALVARLLARE
jgi:beta-phosphoglucomutase